MGSECEESGVNPIKNLSPKKSKTILLLLNVFSLVVNLCSVLYPILKYVDTLCSCTGGVLLHFVATNNDF